MAEAPSPYRAEQMVAAAIEDRRVALEEVERLKAALAEERGRANVLAEAARLGHERTDCPDPDACILGRAIEAHDAAREAAR